MSDPSANAQSPAPSQPWQMWACLDMLNDIQEQIRFADTKAGFIAVFNVLLFGFIANHVDKLRMLCAGRQWSGTMVALVLALVGVYVVSTTLTFGLVVCSVVSRFGGRVRQGRVFYAHIAAQYGNDHKRYARDLAQMSGPDWLEELGAQIVEVSRLAVLKHKYVRWAAKCTLLSVVLWLVSLTMIVIIAWSQSGA